MKEKGSLTSKEGISFNRQSEHKRRNTNIDPSDQMRGKVYSKHSFWINKPMSYQML